MPQAVDYFSAMFTGGFFRGPVYGQQELLLCAILIVIEWLQRDKQHALQIENVRLFHCRPVRWGVYYLLLVAIAYFAGASQTFIYFQF